MNSSTATTPPSQPVDDPLLLRDQLEFALAVGDLGEWVLDLTHRTSRRNRRHDEIFGLDGPSDAWTAEAFLDRVIPADRPLVEARFREAVASCSAWEADCRIRRTDGALRHIWIKGSARPGAAGRADRMLSVIRDITERREDEARQAFLARLAEALRPVSSAADVGALASRLLAEHLGAQRVAYFEIIGEDYLVERDYAAGVRSLAGRYPVASFGPTLLSALLAGTTVVEVDATTEPTRPPAEQAAFAAIHVRGHVDVPLVKRGRFIAGMTVHMAQPRHWSPQEVSLIEDTAERTWAAIEQVRAEAALRESEERLAFVRRSSGVGFWYCDLPFDVLEWDDLVKHHFHLAPDAVVTIDTFYERIHPEDREPTRQAIERSITQHGRYTTDYRTVDPGTGAVKWVRAIGRTFYAPDGTPIRFDGVTLDVTDQKLAEARLKDSEQRLREANRRKDEFLAMLAHELRNPLAPIAAAADILRIASGNAAQVARTGTIISRQVRHMTSLVDDLLDVSRVTRGLVKLEKVPMDVNQAVLDAIEQVRPLIENRRHELTLHTGPDATTVHADPDRLVQVVTNLLTNSAKYTPEGGWIRVDVRVEGDEVQLGVSDNGQGMAPDLVAGCFELFVQAERTSERAAGGLGIGLALVRSLVELHGGSVSAASGGPGQGSRFTVRLPRSQRPAAPAAPVPANESLAASGTDLLKVLVVDDNRDAAEMMAMLAQAMGHETQVEHHPLRALERIGSDRFDVCLLDIGMPGMDGYELARAIRQKTASAPVTLIAVTGYGQPHDRQRALEAGFDEHFTKPLDSEKLAKLLSGH